jgi:hypothetical protein
MNMICGQNGCAEKGLYMTKRLFLAVASPAFAQVAAVENGALTA